MSWYYGVFSCGCSGRVNIIGAQRDREWKKERAFNDICPECWEECFEKERERANQEALQKAKELELPSLEGSEKQITWATTLRQELLDKLDKLIDECKADDSKWESWQCINGLKGVELEQLKEIKNYIAEKKTSSRYYIDSRNGSLAHTIASVKRDALKSYEEQLKDEYEKKLEIEIKLENTVYPIERITDAIADIKIEDRLISVKFEKNEKFRDLVKQLGFRFNWPNKAWERKLEKTNGAPLDRAAELGNKLLDAGFPICADLNIRERALAGDFSKEQKLWIFKRTSESLVIKWSGRDDLLYKRARSLPGSKWDAGVVIGIEHSEEVKEFAELFGFSFTEKAQELIDIYEKARSDIQAFEVEDVSNPKSLDGLQEILNNKVGVIDDLKD